MKESKSEKNLLSIISLFASILVFAGAILIYFYSNGWRFDFLKQSVQKTGVLTVESEPFLADIYINGVLKGKTPKSMSLPVGIYNVRVHKEGYTDWSKNIEIKEEKSTPIIPWLIKNEITKENIFTLNNEKYINSWINITNDHMFVLTNTEDNITKKYQYKLWRYNINTTFWDLSPNPKVVLTIDTLTPQIIDILLSPNGQFAILTVQNETSTKKYYLDTNQVSTLSNLESIPIEPFSAYSISWSKDNKYLMFESDQELISFNIDRKTKYLLFKKDNSQKYIWTTDEQGYFYYIVNNSEYAENPSVYAYLLYQTGMDGSSPKLLVDDLFFQKNTEYIKAYQSNTGDNKYNLYKNSPQSTKSAGQINQLEINQNAKGAYIGTDQASYWYNINEKKYILITPYPSSFVQYSNDNFKLIFHDSNGYGVFTFRKEDGDHTMIIGSQIIKDLSKDATNVRWLSNSANISYVENNTLYVADKEGENKTALLNNINLNIFTGITYSKEDIFNLIVTSQSEVNTVSIDRYQIH